MMYLNDRVNRLARVVIWIRNILLQPFGGRFGKGSLVGGVASSETVFEIKELALLPGHSLCFKLGVEGVSSQLHALAAMPSSCCRCSSLWWNLISGTIGSNKPFLREFVLVITFYHFNRKLSNILINVSFVYMPK